jgi:integrase
MLSEPWFREFDGWWYTYDRRNGGRKQVKLVKGRDNREAAYDRWSELRRGVRAASSAPTACVAVVLDTYLDWCKANRSAATYDLYVYLLQSFTTHVGGTLSAGDLRPKHVTAWLDASAWSDSTKATAVQTLKAAFRWLAREGHVEKSPVQDARAPARRSREVILSADDFAAILKHARPEFALLLEFIWHSGCRPQEAVKVEVRHVELELRRIVFPASEAKGKKHPRVIYLDDRAFQIVRGLVEKRGQGILFRNAKGKPWNRNMVRCRFRVLRKKLGGRKFCAYHLRHSYATNALQKLDPISVATLMGHSDATTLARNYQHLAKLPTVMIDAAKKATS